VLMRLRNPWSFLRLRLFGLKDGFIAYTPPSSKQTFFRIIKRSIKKVKSKARSFPRGNYPHKNISRIVDIRLSTKTDFDKIIYSLYTKYRGVNMCQAPVVVFVDKCEKSIAVVLYIWYYNFVLERE
jgi:hypothetical protein